MISKTHISGQKPHRRQLNKKVCGSKSAIFVILSFFFFFVQTILLNNDNSKTVQALTLILARNGRSSQRAASQPLSVFIASNSPWSIKAIHNTLWSLFVVKDAIFKVQSSKFIFLFAPNKAYRYSCKIRICALCKHTVKCSQIMSHNAGSLVSKKSHLSVEGLWQIKQRYADL